MTTSFKRGDRVRFKQAATWAAHLGAEFTVDRVELNGRMVYFRADGASTATGVRAGDLELVAGAALAPTSAAARPSASNPAPRAAEVPSAAPPLAAATAPAAAPAQDYASLRASVGNNVEALAVLRDCEALGVSAAGAAMALLDSGALAADEEGDRRAYARSSRLQREFSSVGNYVAFRRAERAGREHLHKGAVVASRGGDDASWTAEYGASAALQHEFGPVGGLKAYIALKRHGARQRR